MAKYLVTGGLGYIGSHTCIELIEAGHRVRIVNNLSNSKLAVLDRIETICGSRPDFLEADIRDRAAMVAALEGCAAVIHFAGLKAVGESVSKPLLYYRNNVEGSIALFEAMAEAGVKTVVFSSSATVYGDPAEVPIRETAALSATNPYGRSKLMIEDILRDIATATARGALVLLRYFNPVGAHASGLIGEDPNGIPNNLMPYVAQVAVGKLACLSVFGDDYPTPDGTGVRDYIHVVDLAKGHLAALVALVPARRPADGESRYRSWLFRAGDGAGLRGGQRPCRALSHRAAPRRRHRRVLRRSRAGQGTAWLAGREGSGPPCAPTPGAGNPGTRRVSPAESPLQVP